MAKFSLGHSGKGSEPRRAPAGPSFKAGHNPTREHGTGHVPHRVGMATPSRTVANATSPPKAPGGNTDR